MHARYESIKVKQKCSSTFRINYTSTHEINRIIYSLKNKDSCGYNKISTSILQISAPYILSPLTHICNKILSTGTFPARLKFSEVRPLFKKGSKGELSNYRPISLLTTFSKIIERIIYKNLYNYLTVHNIFAAEQFGSREGLSTDMATHALLNSVLLSLDKNNLVRALFCDLEKAFNCVNHNILLLKMEFYGISGTANKSYLEDRFQRVVIKDNMLNKTASTWEPIKHGVPQGSILGCLLFLIYINDLAQISKDLVNPILFADNTCFIISNRHVHEFKMNANLVLNESINWFHSNLLSLNFNKTHLLQFLTKQQNKVTFQIIVPDSIIANINSTKFLGLLIDNTLSCVVVLKG